MKIVRVEKDAWRDLSENAHLLCFDKTKDPSTERIDFALLAVGEREEPIGYVTLREIDKDTVYWQFGGSFENARGTIKSFQIYQSFVRYSKEHYKRVTTLIENDNLVMLKMAMKVGFRIIGIRNFKGSVLLEHLLEFENAV